MTFKFRSILALGLLIACTILSCDDSEKKAAEEKIKIEAEAQKKEATQKAAQEAKEEKMRVEAEATSIAAKAMETESLSTLVSALKAADLVPMMTKSGSYTVFAPSNNAFNELPKGTVETLLKQDNKDMLTNLLQYHVVKGKITAEELGKAIDNGKGSYTFKTLNGGELTAMKDGDQIVLKDSRGKKSQVVLGNVEASNGVVHVVNNVLMEKK